MKIYPKKYNNIIIKPASSAQQKIVNENLFRGECDYFFSRISSRTLKSNIYHIGKFLNDYFQNGVNEFQANLLLQKIKSLLQKDDSKDTINLINVIYSTIIKNVKPANIVSNSLQAKTYRQLIDNSVEMYKKYPIKESGTDYRHILGRLAYLYNMNHSIERMPSHLKTHRGLIMWTCDDQLNIIHIIEKILCDYKNANANFVISPQIKDKGLGLEMFSNKKADFESLYLNNIVALIRMLAKTAQKLATDENPDIEEIYNCIEMANFYSNKIPYNDSRRMPILNRAFLELRAVLNRGINKK